MNQKLMKKISAVLIMSGLALCATGCFGKKEDSVKAIQETGVLNVAIVNTDSSYTHLEADAPAGMEPELVEMIASALGVTASYQVLDSGAALDAVTSGAADIALGCMNGTASLSENYLYSTAYGKGFFYVVTEKGDFAQTAGAFAGSAVGVEHNLGEEIRSELRRPEGVSLLEYSSPEEAARDIKNGNTRAYVCREEQAKRLLSDSGLQVQNLLNVSSENYSVIAGKEDAALINGINVIIRQFLEKE